MLRWLILGRRRRPRSPHPLAPIVGLLLLIGACHALADESEACRQPNELQACNR